MTEIEKTTLTMLMDSCEQISDCFNLCVDDEKLDIADEMQDRMICLITYLVEKKVNI
jgi:hypothetical protein